MKPWFGYFHFCSFLGLVERPTRFLGCIVFPMTSPKMLFLGVTPPKGLLNLRRRTELCSIDFTYKLEENKFRFQYWFIRYAETLPSNELDRGVIPKLLTLCPPNLPVYSDRAKRVIADGIATERKQQLEGISEVPDLNKQEVVRFITRYGVIGLDSPLRASIARTMTKNDLWLWFRLSPKHSAKVWRRKKTLEAFKKHQIEIAKGNEVPLWVVEENLRTLSRFARLTLALLEYKETKGERYSKRVVTAWQQVVPVPDTADPASAKYDKLKAWRSKDKQGLTILSPENVARIFDDFASRLNFFLKPFSSLLVTTERIQSYKAKGYGLEVIFSAYCLTALNDENKVAKRCAVCRLGYIPTRNKEDGLYCPSCKAKRSQKKHRDRKKKK